MLNGWFSSRRDFSSSQGRGFGRAEVVIEGLSSRYALIFAVSNRHAPAGLLDRFACERQVGDLLEGEFLVGFQVAGVDVVLVRPLGALAHEALVEREDAVFGQNVDRVFRLE